LKPALEKSSALFEFAAASRGTLLFFLPFTDADGGFFLEKILDIVKQFN
jgi:hypothetical protein